MRFCGFFDTLLGGYLYFGSRIKTHARRFIRLPRRFYEFEFRSFYMHSRAAFRKMDPQMHLFYIARPTKRRQAAPRQYVLIFVAFVVILISQELEKYSGYIIVLPELMEETLLNTPKLFTRSDPRIHHRQTGTRTM